MYRKGEYALSNAITENKMGYAPMLKLIISMSLPSMFSMIIQALYNVVDSIFVAQFDQRALTAVSIALPLQMLLVAVAVGSSIGMNSLMSRKLGEGKTSEASCAAVHGILLSVLSSLVFLVIGIFATRPFFTAYTSDPVIIEYGVQYTSICLIFCFGAFVEITIEKALQATGDMIFPMLIQLSGAVVNIIFDPLLIFGIGPFPQMGAAGAAVATVSGQIVAMLIAITVLIVRKNKIKVTFKGFRPSLSMIKSIYAVGFPSIIMQSISSVLIVALNSILIGFSSDAVNVFGIYFKLQNFIFMPVFGLTHGVMPIMGFNYGARKKSRLLSALKYGIMIAAIIMALGTLLLWLCPQWLLLMFNATQNMLDIGVIALRIISLHFVFAAAGIMLSTFFQALGKGVKSLIMSVMRQIVVILPVAYAMSFVGLEYIWYSFLIAELVSLSLGIFFFIRMYKTELKAL